MFNIEDYIFISNMLFNTEDYILMLKFYAVTLNFDIKISDYKKLKKLKINQTQKNSSILRIYFCI